MLKILPLFMVLLASVGSSLAADSEPNFLNEEELDLYCLQKAYPQIKSIISDESGTKWLSLHNGRAVPYQNPEFDGEGLNVDVKTSLHAPYPLEPERPLPASSPGRKRPYDFFFALYGNEPREVQKKLSPVSFNGSRLYLTEQAAASLNKAARELTTLTEIPELKKYLKPDGAYYWRKIAGEPWLSAHSFGIAIDLGANAAPYWRWQKKLPHPLQKTYSDKIVKIMEDNGFIWGGKWREYDLMHFEYRPELICKAKMRKNLKTSGKAAIPAGQMAR